MKPVLAALLLCACLCVAGYYGEPATAGAAVEAESAPSGLDRDLRDRFLDYLGTLKDDKPAAEVRAYLLAYPKLKFSVSPDMLSEGKNRYWALFYSESFQVRISGPFVAGTGYSASGGGMTPEDFNKFIATASPLLVHETVHAKTFTELGFDASGALEDELLCYAYEAWHVRSDPALATPGNRELGEAFYAKLAPAAATFARDLAGISPAGRIELTNRYKKLLGRLRGGQEYRTPAILSYSLWVAFERGWPAFIEYTHLFSLTKDPVLAEPKRRRAYLGYMAALNVKAAKEGKAAAAGQLFRKLLSFWKDDGKVAAAKTYFQEKLAAPAAASGQAAPIKERK